MQYGYLKTQNLTLISNPLKRLHKNSREKFINEKVTDNWSFSFFSLCAKVLGLYLFCSDFLKLFSTDWNSAWNFVFYDTHIKILKQQCFVLRIALFAKPDETAQKTKNIFYKCVLDSYFTSISFSFTSYVIPAIIVPIQTIPLYWIEWHMFYKSAFFSFRLTVGEPRNFGRGRGWWDFQVKNIFYSAILWFFIEAVHWAVSMQYI